MAPSKETHADLVMHDKRISSQPTNSSRALELVDDEKETPQHPHNERGQPYLASTDVLVS
jgi:hypothetical protein